MANQTNTQKKEFTMEQVFALWKNKSKNGKVYFSGKRDDNGGELTAFFVTNKKNPNEPDIRVYDQIPNGDLSKDPYISMWCNLSKSGKKYLTGKIGDKRIVAFVNDEEGSTRPYVSAYYSKEKQEAEQTKIPEYEEQPF